MGLAGGNRPHPRAIIFDLDRCLIDSRNAWRYCVEESIASTRGRRIDASALVDEYHVRPWRDALSVLAESHEEAVRCEHLCRVMFERSAMKKLLVHEGVGMALDSLRGERIELGAISRLPHALSIKQVQSTGLDRFLAVVASSPDAGAWQPRELIERCLNFLETTALDSAFLGAQPGDIVVASSMGLRPYLGDWATDDREEREEDPTQAISMPAGVLERVMNDWAYLARHPN